MLTMTTPAYQGTLQEWDAGSSRIRNLTGFGEDLTKCLRRKAFMELLPGHGWLDGGCLTLAWALEQWTRVSAGQPVGSFAAVEVVNADGTRQPTHILLRIGDAYLDGDGIGTEADVLAKMRDFELETGELSINPDLVLDLQELENRGILLYDEICGALVKRLADAMGDFDAYLFQDVVDGFTYSSSMGISPN